MFRWPYTFLFSLVIWLAACSGRQVVALPTLAPVVQLPAPPTATLGINLPPTRNLTPSATPPTAVQPADPLPTPLPTATATPVQPLINLTAPDNEVEIALGSVVVVRGLAQLAPTQMISVSLVSGNGRFLTSTQAVVSDFGWEAGLTVPQTVSGAATFYARILDATGISLAEDRATVTLILDTTQSERYLALYHPISGETAVAGYFLFFDGQVRQQVGGGVTISIWADNCQREAAKFRLNFNGGGYWQGSLGIPGDLTGEACAVAYFGTPGEDTWREAQVPITIYAANDSRAGGIQIAYPPANGTAVAGQPLLISGTAFNAANVTVSILMADGLVIGEQSTIPGAQGFWEMQLDLPYDVTGTAEITAIAFDNRGNERARAQSLITILPAPTPTP